MDINAVNKKEAKSGFDWAMCLIASSGKIISFKDNDALFKKKMRIFIAEMRPEIEFGWNLEVKKKKRSIEVY